PSTAAAQSVDFNRDVLPLLSANCFPCHGPDANKRKADLRLDDRAAALGKGGGPTVIVPGKPNESELIARVSSDKPAVRMPPPKAGPQLPPDQVRPLRRWIEEGAPYAEHWAFMPPKRPDPPAVRETTWPRTPVDAFVLHRLERLKLPHAAPASRE